MQRGIHTWRLLFKAARRSWWYPKGWLLIAPICWCNLLVKELLDIYTRTKNGERRCLFFPIITVFLDFCVAEVCLCSWLKYPKYYFQMTMEHSECSKFIFEHKTLSLLHVSLLNAPELWDIRTPALTSEYDKCLNIEKISANEFKVARRSWWYPKTWFLIAPICWCNLLVMELLDIHENQEWWETLSKN